jgi:hypothetical protein
MEALKLGWIALETWGTDDKKFIESRIWSSRIQSQQRQGKELIELAPPQQLVLKN